MPAPMNIPRKVQQLDNDVQSIYEMLADIQATQKRHGNRFDAVDLRLDNLETKVDSMDTRLGSLETKVGSLETKVEGVDAKVDTVIELLRAERR